MADPTPDDSARTWRDLADQLTAEQIAILEDHERHRRDYGTPWSDSEQLDIARRHARQNLTDEVLFGHIAPRPTRHGPVAGGAIDTTIGLGDSTAPNAPSMASATLSASSAPSPPTAV